MFQYKTPAEIEAMTEYQREKYFDEKRKHEEAEAEKRAKAAAEEAVQGVKQELEDQKKANEGLKTEFEAIKLGKEESDKRLEDALAKMNRLKVEQHGERIKNMSDAILEKLSSEEGEKALKEIVNNKNGGFSQEFDVNVKAVGTMSKPAGSTEPQIVPYIGIAHEVVQARNIIPVSPTNRDTIKYLQYTKKEGSIGTVAAGALKPQIDYNVTPKEAPVRKIAGWITLEDEFLEDIESARDFLAEELPKAYLDVETFQIFKGNGTGQNLNGIYTQAQALVLPAGNGLVTAASNSWDKIAAALTQVRKNLRAADAIWVSPDVYLTLLINKGNTEEYTYPIVSDVNGRVTIGGVPIFQHTIFGPTEGIAGDFRTGARIFQKKAMQIRTSTEHGENFTHNLTTILIEGRIALPVYFPEGFVKIDFTTPAPEPGE